MGGGASTPEGELLFANMNENEKVELFTEVYKLIQERTGRKDDKLCSDKQAEIVDVIGREIEHISTVSTERVYGCKASLPNQHHKKVFFVPLKSGMRPNCDLKISLDSKQMNQHHTSVFKTIHSQLEEGIMETEDKYPEKVDLRTTEIGLPPVQNQGNLGSCTSFSIGNTWTYDGMREKIDSFIPSHLHIYYNERKLRDTISKDSGASISDSVQVIEQTGVCHENLWPYDTNKFRQTPPEICYQEAKKDRALKAYKIDKTKADQFMAALAKGFIVNIGMVVYSSFQSEEVAKTGVVPSPYPQKDDKSLGGHAVSVVGYEKNKHWIVMNSWGTEWGDKGFFYLPWDFMTSENVMEAWVVTSITEKGQGSPQHQLWWFDPTKPEEHVSSEIHVSFS